MLKVGKSINYLLTNSEVNTIVNGKIFPIIADQGTSFPFITYRRAGSGDSFSKDSIYEDFTTVELVIASASYEESVELAQLCREELEKRRYSNIKEIKLVDASELYEGEVFIQNLLFTIKLNK